MFAHSPRPTAMGFPTTTRHLQLRRERMIPTTTGIKSERFLWRVSWAHIRRAQRRGAGNVRHGNDGGLHAILLHPIRTPHSRKGNVPHCSSRRLQPFLGPGADICRRHLDTIYTVYIYCIYIYTVYIYCIYILYIEVFKTDHSSFWKQNASDGMWWYHVLSVLKRCTMQHCKTYETLHMKHMKHYIVKVDVLYM